MYSALGSKNEVKVKLSAKFTMQEMYFSITKNLV